jgi:F0F1-type ATP synthase assembly protein I
VRFHAGMPNNLIDTKQRKYYLFALRIVGDFGASIALPVVLFVLIGQWLDSKYQRTPLFTIIAFVLAAIVSGRIIYRKAKTYGKEFNDLDK